MRVLKQGSSSYLGVLKSARKNRDPCLNRGFCNPPFSAGKRASAHFLCRQRGAKLTSDFETPR
jgi:hypothetical protein